MSARLTVNVRNVDSQESKVTASSSTSGCNIHLRVMDDGRLLVDVDRPDGVVELRYSPQVKVNNPR